nr:hypothetical protein [uncultured Erwinia sp.]
MSTQFEKLEKEMKELVSMGKNLYFSMLIDTKKIEGPESEETKEAIEKGLKYISVKGCYQSWYTKSHRVISQVIKERLAEFELLYKSDPKRKEISVLNYSMSDYLSNITTSRAGRGIICSPVDAVDKMEFQFKILESAQERFTSTLFDIKDIVQADIFDSELDTAKELNKKGFIRAAGAVTGVILEKHLAHVCSLHNIKPKKAHPSISEYNNSLKDSDIIDTSTWRFIQHLGDIRNLCDHGKEREPKKDEVSDFITGVDKITKTVF